MQEIRHFKPSTVSRRFMIRTVVMSGVSVKTGEAA
jgi:hypothetical protein